MLQAGVLLVGLVAIGFVVAQTVDAAEEQVLPTWPALLAAGVLSLLALMSAARSWEVLFRDLLRSPSQRMRLRGTFYLSQLTKYLPAGGVVQAVGQLGLARAVGIPLARSSVAFPVSVIGVSAASATLGAGLVLSSDLPNWIRAVVVLALAGLVFLDRRILGAVLDLLHRRLPRVPDSRLIPAQGRIFGLYVWAIAAVGGYAAAYAVLLSSLDPDVNPYFVFCAFSVSWLVGFLAVPLPAGVGAREGALLLLLPATGPAPVLAASLALRLLSIATELLATGGNRLATHRLGDTDESPPAPVDTDSSEVPHR